MWSSLVSSLILQKPHLIDSEHPYEIVKTIALGKMDYGNFCTDMLADRQFIEDYYDLCGTGPVWKCLFVHQRGRADGILIGQTSEIDVVYITQKGIFVFESKNYSGWIFGDEDGMYWTVSLPNGQKNRFYNPIKQNRTHLKWLGKFLGGGVPLFSIVVFSERCELKKITVNCPDIKVIKRDRIYATVRELWENADDSLADGQIEALFDKLKALTNADEAVKLTHAEDVERIKTTRVPEAKTCPRCGKPLVLRTAKKGDHAGEQFYGCSGFPGCRYSEKM